MTANAAPAAAVWHALMDELCGDSARDAQKTALLSHLSQDVISADMLAAAAEWMLARAQPLVLEGGQPIDVCGTGGDAGKGAVKTFNVSTAVAFVAAAAGACVVKHGNRAVSSASGSSDVLAALRVPVCTSQAQAQAQYAAHNLCFVSAPAFHPVLGVLTAVRRAVGKPTFLNLLGPLCNPARTPVQLFGVYSQDFLPAMMEAARALGRSVALGVHSMDGLDEISICAPTCVYKLEDGHISQETFTPETLGIARAPAQDIQGGTAADNAFIITNVFTRGTGPQADIVALNAGAALAAAGIAGDWKDGLARARHALESGAALEKLRRMQEER